MKVHTRATPDVLSKCAGRLEQFKVQRNSQVSYVKPGCLAWAFQESGRCGTERVDVWFISALTLSPDCLASG